MSACKTGCGRDTGKATLCVDCLEEWADSTEERRGTQAATPEARAVALTDFCNRIRAERQNGRPE